jgi:hypothetical protein
MRPKDSNLGELAAGLSDPVEFVCSVLLALKQNGGSRTNPRVRVATSMQGDRTAPNYQIIEIMDAETGQSMPLATYSGKTHKGLTYTDKTDLAYWSEASSDFVEVQNLIGMLRKSAKS